MKIINTPFSFIIPVFFKMMPEWWAKVSFPSDWLPSWRQLYRDVTCCQLSHLLANQNICLVCLHKCSSVLDKNRRADCYVLKDYKHRLLADISSLWTLWKFRPDTSYRQNCFYTSTKFSPTKIDISFLLWKAVLRLRIPCSRLALPRVA